MKLRNDDCDAEKHLNTTNTDQTNDSTMMINIVVEFNDWAGGVLTYETEYSTFQHKILDDEVELDKTVYRHTRA